VVKCLNQADKELLMNLQSTIQSIGSEKLDALLLAMKQQDGLKLVGSRIQPQLLTLNRFLKT
jgi:hypothetical protein